MNGNIFVTSYAYTAVVIFLSIVKTCHEYCILLASSRTADVAQYNPASRMRDKGHDHRQVGITDSCLAWQIKNQRSYKCTQFVEYNIIDFSYISSL